MTLIDASVTGGAAANCAVCGDPTTMRRVWGDGHVPMCSRFCDHAWPHVHRLYSALREIAGQTAGSDYIQQWPIRSLQDAVQAAHRIAQSALSESADGD